MYKSRFSTKPLIMSIILLWSASGFCQDETDEEQQSQQCLTSYCLEEGSIEFALGLGLGVRTNPLNSGDNIPLLVVPDIAWYGNNWYLDNFEIGYQWLQHRHFAVETFATLNLNNRDFVLSSASNLLLDGSNMFATAEGPLAGNEAGENGDLGITAPMEGDMGLLPEPTIPPNRELGEIPVLRLTADDVSDRDFAYDIGVRAHWYGDSSEWSLAIMRDASNVYDGFHARGQYRKLWQLGEWNLVSSVSLQWQSADLLDYYYGIDEKDTEDRLFHYEADSGWLTTVGLSANREITENWRWLFHLSYSHLPNAMVDSPLVSKDYIISTFAGVTYRF